MGNHAVFHMLDDGLMDVAEAGGGDADIVEAHAGDGFQHHIHHVISPPEMVVEGDGHPVPELHPADGLLQGGENFIVAFHALHQGTVPVGMHPLAAAGLVDLIAALQLGDGLC